VRRSRTRTTPHFQPVLAQHTKQVFWRDVVPLNLSFQTGLVFHAQLKTLSLDSVAPVPLSPVERIVGPPDQRLGAIIRAADRYAEARGNIAALIIDLLRDDRAQPLGQQVRLYAIGLQRDDQKFLPAPSTECIG